MQGPRERFRAAMRRRGTARDAPRWWRELSLRAPDLGVSRRAPGRRAVLARESRPLRIRAGRPFIPLADGGKRSSRGQSMVAPAAVATRSVTVRHGNVVKA